MSRLQANNEEFLRLLREGKESTDPKRILEIHLELNRLNQEYLGPVTEPLEVKVPAS